MAVSNAKQLQWDRLEL